MENIQVIEPESIGPYKMYGTVGDGAFSVVKLVKNTLNNQYFACKIVPKARLNTENLEERFELEIRIAQQMHHPGIVELCDLFQDENNYYVIMEFCPNGELFQFIVDRANLTEHDAKPLFRQILESLQYVHSRNISHRDMKPENLLIDNLGRIKLSDFGLSRFVDSNGLVKTPCGSPCYASPECISGKHYNGKTTDVWSCGVILYAMLTGQLPWTKRNQAQLFKQIKSGDFSIPDELSMEASSLIVALLTVDHTKRITIEEALQHPWLNGVGVQYGFMNSINHYVNSKNVDLFFGNVCSELNLNQKDNNLAKSISMQCLTLNKTAKLLIGSNLPRIRTKLRGTPQQTPKESSKLSSAVLKPTPKSNKKEGPLSKISRVTSLKSHVSKPTTLHKITAI